MSQLQYPSRIFSLSDCHGGHATWNPLESPDVAARLAEAVRSDLPGIEHFDTYGVPERYYDHIVREAVRLHKENPSAQPTGLFVNNAPRTKAKNNGEPFYLAEFEENIRIVTTPLHALAAVRKSVKKLFFLPNQNNGLYDGEKEQHRSSFVPRLLAQNHGLNLTEVDPQTIPEPAHGCVLTYVDRFGNLVLFENANGEATSLRAKIKNSDGQRLKLTIGKHTEQVLVGRSLSLAQPGELVIYSNDNSLEILRKWESGWSFEERITGSAYSKFLEPQMGDQCELE